MFKQLITLISITLFCFSSYAQSPNILLIIADDLGVDALNGYNIGSIKPTTPHLDSLRNSGVTFMNAWSSSVCSPTRGGIMSGKYGSKNDVKTVPANLDTSHVSIFKMLKDTSPSYITAVSGKWHVSHPANVQHTVWHGTDHYTGLLEGAVASYDNWNKTENGLTTTSTDYVTSYLTDDAVNWINNQNNPWHIWITHVAPHTPLHVPPSYMHSQLSTNSQIKKFMAMIESLDYEVGRLLDSIPPSVLANTTIIFIGDNGTSNNVLQDYPLNHGKQTLYQGGIHVPMFVSGYGVSRIGETEDALVNVIDIYATILELAGAQLDGGIYNSLSLKHLLSSSTLPKRQYNFTELDTNSSNINTQGFTIRNNIYKLIEYYTGAQEMFNLDVDPLETNNLLLGTLSTQEQLIKTELQDEANQRIIAWSCKDDIKNGDENGIDCGGTYCSPCATGIISLEINNGVNIYPNPVRETLIIQAKETYHLTIKNSEGKIVKKTKINVGINTISLEELPSGMYFIVGFNSSTRFAEKVIVKE